MSRTLSTLLGGRYSFYSALFQYNNHNGFSKQRNRMSIKGGFDENSV